jgi:hypothetical protein
MLARMQQLSPLEVAVAYNAATDDERVVMEHASAQDGRGLPMKSGRGLEWKPMLDTAAVAASREARARAANPAGVEKLREIEELRAMHVTIAGHAVAEVK